MSENEITLTSTTNTPEEINAALGVVAPVADATPAPAVVAAPAVTEPTAPAAVPAAAAPPVEQKKSKAAERIAALVAERNEESKARRAAEEKATALEARLAASQPAAPATPDTVVTPPAEAAAPAADLGPEPKEDDYGSWSEYSSALIAFKVKEALAATGANKPIEQVIKDTIAKTAKEAEVANESATALKKFNDGIDAAKAKYPDYQARLDEAAPRAPVSQWMEDVLLRSEIPGEILYHFAQHPEEAARISKLPQGTAYVEMGKIEARLQVRLENSGSAPAAARPAVPAAPISHAPAPIAPVGMSGGTSNPNVPLDEMPYDQFKKMREQSGARR